MRMSTEDKASPNASRVRVRRSRSDCEARKDVAARVGKFSLGESREYGEGGVGREGKQAISHEAESLYLYTNFKRHGSGVGVNGLVRANGCDGRPGRPG